MTRPLPGYSPLERDADPAGSGLVRGTTPTGLGVVRHHHVRVRGSDTATVLLHGAAGSWTTWTPLIRTARDAGVPFADVVAIDLPGWGGSPLDATDDEATVDAIADAVRAVVDGLGYAAGGSSATPWAASSRCTSQPAIPIARSPSRSSRPRRTRSSRASRIPCGSSGSSRASR